MTFNWLKLGQRAGPNGHSGPAGSNGHDQDAGRLLTEAMIDLRNITKVYETAAGPFLALKDVNLRVWPGEFAAVVGKSGSGKSTLINMFTGIDHPTAGEAIVARARIGQLDESQMAVWRGRNLGIVFQFFQLLPTLTLVENVMLPMDLCQMVEAEERYERAMELLERVGLTVDADKFPAAVSGGHQQQVAIARALANDPPILVADEPTGNLDSRAADAIFRLFESLADQGKTILMVTHDEDLARRVPRVLTLSDGQIANELVRLAPLRWCRGSSPGPCQSRARMPVAGDMSARRALRVG